MTNSSTLRTARLGLAVSLVASLLLTLAPAPASAACYPYLRSEKGFARKINGARAARDVSKLRLDPQLSRAAKVHTREMVKTDSLWHTSFTTLDRRVTNWVLIGENVGRGSGVSSLHRAFMDSTDHRANVLKSAYRYVGVGVVRKNGTMWVTVLFEATDNPGTTLRMPSC